MKAVQVRLPEAAYEALRMIADVNEQDLGETARVILTEALLGKSHAVMMTAERFARAVKNGRER